MVHAVSLSFRDLLVLRGQYVLPVKPDVIPVSDGAGQVVAVGPGVQRVRPGDRVTATVFPQWLDGPLQPSSLPQLGGSLDGMLTELAVMPEQALVPHPRAPFLLLRRGSDVAVCRGHGVELADRGRSWDPARAHGADHRIGRRIAVRGTTGQAARREGDRHDRPGGQGAAPS
ncbi:alcohol dehydrogenase catalytic domain-containing protein [Microbispora sp. H10836]|uniref:alcohol dehydrogenase catalytic domain-containing protein n=1 Tax=Microbispora sp. H10836 TaxID=2729106 RepID=UPI0037C665C2